MVIVSVALVRIFRKRGGGPSFRRDAVLDLLFSIAAMAAGAYWWADAVSPAPRLPTEGTHIGYIGALGGILTVTAAGLSAVRALRDLSTSVPTPKETTIRTWMEHIVQLLAGTWRSARKDFWLTAALLACALDLGIVVAVAAGCRTSIPIIGTVVLVFVTHRLVTRPGRSRTRRATVAWVWVELLAGVAYSLVVSTVGVSARTAYLVAHAPYVIVGGYLMLGLGAMVEDILMNRPGSSGGSTT